MGDRLQASGAPVRVLLVEDSPQQARLLALQLEEVERPRFRLLPVARLSEALARLEGGGVDAVLVDLTLPDARDLEAVSQIHARAPAVPLVVLTGMDDETLAVRALREGAQDYLIKDTATPPTLKRVLLHAIERKRVEETLHASRERFLNAQKLEALGQLAGGIAHDFNNILTSILGYTEMLLGEVGPDSPLCRDLTEIRKSAHRASLLTGQILAFSRRRLARPEPVDLNEAVGGMQEMLGRMLGERILLELRLEPGLPQVVADPGQMEQVMTNLVLNARDAMPEGGEIALETRRVRLDEDHPHRASVPGPGRYVQLCVSDQGCGIPPEALERIFEPFYTTKEPGKGTGLGLAAVYGIVTAGGGGIHVDSQTGRGSTFRLYFPEVPDVVSSGGKPVAGASPLEAGGGSVLVVEDEPALRAMLERILQRSGYRVLLASGGLEGLRESERWEGSLDLLLTDMILPDMDGWELARAAQVRRPGLRVLFMTGYTDRFVEEAHVLHKPFAPSALLARLREVLAAPAGRLPDA